jgi:calcium/calmodulin-dependent 3',5'-cyclic nucleotide phosphodiesterase
VKELRTRSINNILATDMIKHRALVQDFGELLQGLKIAEENDDFDKLKIDRAVISELLIHTSDIFHPTKPWEIHERWSKRANLEFMI